MVWLWMWRGTEFFCPLCERLIFLGRLIGCMLFTVFLGNISRIGDLSLSCEKLYVLDARISLKATSEDLWYPHLTPCVRLPLPDCPERYSNPQIAHHPTYPLTSIHVNTNYSSHRCRQVGKIEDASWEKCVFMYIFMVDLYNGEECGRRRQSVCPKWVRPWRHCPGYLFPPI